MHEEITFALTSCGRFDLLKRTLDSFFKFNTYPIKRLKVVEDSGLLPDFYKEYPQIEWLVNSTKLGQMKSIDRVYADITTKWIFHCEDDWEFLDSGFIEESLAVLKEDRNILQVWLRGKDDTNGHPLIHRNRFDLVTTDFQGMWHGFSLNPGLRRLEDYNMVRPYYLLEKEQDIGAAYKDLGFLAASLHKKYVEHIGWGRHI